MKTFSFSTFTSFNNALDPKGESFGKEVGLCGWLEGRELGVRRWIWYHYGAHRLLLRIPLVMLVDSAPMVVSTPSILVCVFDSFELLIDVVSVKVSLDLFLCGVVVDISAIGYWLSIELRTL
ncbi:hypothetical protein TIFTF001_009362 [Ficus carica]|uniref:Transmembrane protein n=1 Tax=Ficus carica TaxID=3494 RepID=A0AA87ZPS9_FICCA|nr:hypothetical protein TIFTF001_009362 [Ficus carica]